MTLTDNPRTIADDLYRELWGVWHWETLGPEVRNQRVCAWFAREHARVFGATPQPHTPPTPPSQPT